MHCFIMSIAPCKALSSFISAAFARGDTVSIGLFWRTRLIEDPHEGIVSVRLATLCVRVVAGHVLDGRGRHVRCWFSRLRRAWCWPAHRPHRIDDMLTLKAEPWYPWDVPGDRPYLLVTEVSHVQPIMLIDNDSPGKDAACQFAAGCLDLVDGRQRNGHTVLSWNEQRHTPRQGLWQCRTC